MVVFQENQGYIVDIGACYLQDEILWRVICIRFYSSIGTLSKLM